jgi:hypothetical protein
VPVENPHAAFCCRGCWQQYHRKHCCVCERPIEQPRQGSERRRCNRRNCRLELRKWPAVYLPFGPDIEKRKVDVRSARKTALELPHSLRRWSWQKLPGEDQDFELLDAKGKVVAAIRQEGERWWVARPRCIPQPPLEELDAARARALRMALVALPNPLADRNRELIRAMLLERQLYPRRFSDAGERYARGELGGGGPQWEPTASSETPDIPEFLRRSPAQAEAA